MNGKPLLYYTIDAARHLASDENICLSTDSSEIIEMAKVYGLNVPFTRPHVLATDSSGSYEVLLHAYNFYLKEGKKFEIMVLLQPTSPFRNGKQIEEALKLYYSEIDMVVSVCKSEANPYYNLFEDDKNGFIKPSKPNAFIRRQDAPDIYVLNGAIYVINIKSLLKKPLHHFEKVLKYEMDKISSTDIDTPLDWEWAEFLMDKKFVQ